MSEEIKNNIRAAFVSAIGECDVNDESASRGIDSACDVAMGTIAHWKDRAEKAEDLAARLARDCALADHNMMKEDRDRLFHQNASIKRDYDVMFRRAAQADADRERTYHENRILTALWCGLRDKVRALPKSDMTIGCWHELQDFVKNQSHTDGLASNSTDQPRDAAPTVLGGAP